MEMDYALIRQPNDSDPQETAITRKLKEVVLTTSFAKKVIEQSTTLQTAFFEDAFSEKHKPKTIKLLYQKLLENLFIITNAKITSGVETLQELSVKSGVIIITNHLGMIKLAKIDNSQKKFDLPLDSFEPFPLRHSSFLQIANRLNMELHESAIELPGFLSKIQKMCGVLIVNAGGHNRTEQLIKDSQKIIEQKKSVIVMYPEGGTSGKRNNGGPYDLDDFHSGAFVVAKQLSIPVLPITQFFNPKTGFELDIIKPINGEYLKDEDLNTIVTKTQIEMQRKLDSKIKTS